jgi:hypothetical protein
LGIEDTARSRPLRAAAEIGIDRRGSERIKAQKSRLRRFRVEGYSRSPAASRASSGFGNPRRATPAPQHRRSAPAWPMVPFRRSSVNAVPSHRRQYPSSAASGCHPAWGVVP